MHALSTVISTAGSCSLVDPSIDGQQLLLGTDICVLNLIEEKNYSNFVVYFYFYDLKLFAGIESTGTVIDCTLIQLKR